MKNIYTEVLGYRYGAVHDGGKVYVFIQEPKEISYVWRCGIAICESDPEDTQAKTYAVFADMTPDQDGVCEVIETGARVWFSDLIETAEAPYKKGVD